MSLKLYNTRTRTVERFAPIAPPAVRVYVCGLTPSAEAHIGHARTYLFFDVLRRYLIHLGYDVIYVQNVTDIDDRSIAQALATGQDWRVIVANHYASFKVSMNKLGVLPIDPHREPYATDYIPQIVRMIAELMDRGFAYVTKGGVYYRVAKFADYGKLSNRNISELEAGARIEVDEFKEDPLDFALWKFAKPGEPSWESPWGAGRPGWHIECSAMARELLGDQFDLHGGGADLIFPHHENEIAQSEPLLRRRPMANFWVHGGLLLFDSRKMSKSIGNFEPLYELLERHDPQAIRLLFLQTGYSKVMNFTEDSIAAADTGLQKLRENYRLLDATARSGEDSMHWAPASTEAMRTGDFAKYETAIGEALDNDMNTAAAVREIFSLAGNAPILEHHATQAEAALKRLRPWLEIVGLAPDQRWIVEPAAVLPAGFLECLRRELNGQISLSQATSPDEAIKLVIDIRTRARADQKWAESDRLRDALAHCGVALKDSKNGTTWTVAG